MDPVTTGAAVGGAFQTIQSIVAGINRADSLLGTSSIISISKETQIMPLLIIDSSLVNHEFLPDLVQSVQNIFAGYFMQAIEIMTNVSAIKVLNKLRILNPSPEVDRVSLEGFSNTPKSKRVDKLNFDSNYKYRLPTKNNFSFNKNPSTEDSIDFGGKDADKSLAARNDLSIGKMYMVTLCSDDGTKKDSLKIAIRVNSNIMPTASMLTMFSKNSHFNTSWVERYYKMKAGGLKFVKDFLFLDDIVSAHRNAIIKDKSGVYSTIVNQQNTALSKGFANGLQGTKGVISNLFIVNKETIKNIEAKTSWNIKKFSDRKQIMKQGNALIIAVIDTEMDRVEFYYHDLQNYTSLSFKDIKSNNNKSDGTLDVVKMLLQSKAPSFY